MIMDHWIIAMNKSSPNNKEKKQRKNEEKENLAGNGDNEDNSDGNGGRLGAEQSPCMTRFLKKTPSLKRG